MCLPHLAEGLHHRDAGDQLHHGGGHAGKFGIHFHGFRPHIAHHPGHKQAIERECGNGQQPQAPIHIKGIDEEGDRHNHGLGHFHRLVRHHGVNLGHVVMQRLADPPGVGAGKPPQWRVAHPFDGAGPHIRHESSIGEVGYPQCDEKQEDPQAERANQNLHDQHGPVGVDGLPGGVGRGEQATQLDQRDIGGNRQHPGQTG